MWFKNIHLFRLHDAAAIELPDLENAMQENATRPLGGIEAKHAGWAAPAGRKGKILAHEVNGHRLLTMLQQERDLKPAVVKEETDNRAADREHDEGRPLTRREKQAIKEQVYEEFLPRAFPVSKRIDVWWDTARGLIGVNAASRSAAESALDLLRQTLGSLKVTPLATKTLPARAMTEWLEDPAKRPAWLLVGEDAVFEEKGADGKLAAKATCLDTDDIHRLIESGRMATRLAITVDERVSLTLHDDLALKALRFDDKLLDEASQTDDDGDAVLRLETDFVLMGNALRELVDYLIAALGGEALPELASPEAPSPEAA